MNKFNGKTTAAVFTAVLVLLAGSGFGAAGWLYGRSAETRERMARCETRQDAADIKQQDYARAVEARLSRIESKLDRLLEKP